MNDPALFWFMVGALVLSCLCLLVLAISHFRLKKSQRKNQSFLEGLAGQGKVYAFYKDSGGTPSASFWTAIITTPTLDHIL